MNISVNCDKCGAEKLRLEYCIVNRITRYKYGELVCFECGYPSQLQDYFYDPKCRYEYYNSYVQTHNIEDSYEQFTNKTMSYITERIVETVLKYEKNKPIKVWPGYVALQ